jgi:hypothetical protein
MPSTVLSMAESPKPAAYTLSPLLPNTLRILVLVEALIGNGGMDVFNAGLGTDNILINASNITALEQTGAGNRSRIDGGGGIDTLKQNQQHILYRHYCPIL